MNTALKLNKKQLLDLYEKSSAQVKEGLRAEFGQHFFDPCKAGAKICMTAEKAKTTNANKRKPLIDWEMIFDYTQVLRIVGHACLVGFVLAKI